MKIDVLADLESVAPRAAAITADEARDAAGGPGR
jgi:hypothetical protein